MIFTSYEKVFLLKWEEDVTLRNIDEFKAAMNQLIESDSSDLILNFKEVQYVNSAALGTIADSVMTARKNQKELVIVEIQPPVQEIFNIVKFGSFIKFFETEEEGLKYFQRETND
ncbi:STAS domain-containing protein [Calidifontibacillus oryziterrae]|uniref:STAS domain-containing protein n=1 Tax=Calidifontibacillus oryziterrae TaxID=1191699 RepID=UPI0002E55339|nr:STAS domain-containing protein [Calidifontibacillus oryziterrae]